MIPWESLTWIKEKIGEVLIPEAAGRRVAQNMKLPTAGSAGILIRAFQSGIITAEEAEDAFVRIKKSRRHISDRLINSALEIIHSAEK